MMCIKIRFSNISESAIFDETRGKKSVYTSAFINSRGYISVMKTTPRDVDVACLPHPFATDSMSSFASVMHSYNTLHGPRTHAYVV